MYNKVTQSGNFEVSVVRPEFIESFKRGWTGEKKSWAMRAHTHAHTHARAHRITVETSAFFFVVPRCWVCWPVWRQDSENCCQSWLPGGENLKCPTFCQSSFLEQFHVIDFQTCLPDGLRLQSSPAAADVLRGEVSPHGWKHGLKSQRDHLSQQWGDPVNRHQELKMELYSPDGEDSMSIWWTEALLCSFVMQAVSLLEEVVTPRKELPPLLLKLSERRAERLDYLGVSYGLTTQLLRWGFFSMEVMILNITKESFFILTGSGRKQVIVQST